MVICLHASEAWPEDFQAHRLHLHRRIGKDIGSFAVPVHGFGAIGA
jgi:hypothetical protein